MIEQWNVACRTLRLKNVSLFITGSNSKLLSKEFTKELSGRYVAFRVRPFVFLEIQEYVKELQHDYSISDYLVFGGFGVLITLLCLWASRYPRFINLPVVMHPETEQMQNFMKCRYARVLTLLIGLMFLSLLLLCRAMQLEKAWAGVVSVCFDLFLLGILVIVVVASIHVQRLGRR